MRFKGNRWSTEKTMVESYIHFVFAVDSSGSLNCVSIEKPSSSINFYFNENVGSQRMVCYHVLKARIYSTKKTFLQELRTKSDVFRAVVREHLRTLAPVLRRMITALKASLVVSRFEIRPARVIEKRSS
jgi:hypothetical protein